MSDLSRDKGAELLWGALSSASKRLDGIRTARARGWTLDGYDEVWRERGVLDPEIRIDFWEKPNEEARLSKSVSKLSEFFL